MCKLKRICNFKFIYRYSRYTICACGTCSLFFFFFCCCVSVECGFVIMKSFCNRIMSMLEEMSFTLSKSSSPSLDPFFYVQFFSPFFIIFFSFNEEFFESIFFVPWIYCWAKHVHIDGVYNSSSSSTTVNYCHWKKKSEQEEEEDSVCFFSSSLDEMAASAQNENISQH